MAFNSMAFLFGLLPAVLVCYFLLPARWRTGRNWVLLVFSLFFYAWGEPKYVFLMLCSITVDYFIGKRIQKCRNEGRMSAAGRWMLLSVIYNLSVLGFFKYTDFLIGTVNAVFGTDIPLPGIPLPVSTECASLFAADRHFLFYLSDDVVHDRRIPRRDAGTDELAELRHLCFYVPAAHCRTDRAI